MKRRTLVESALRLLLAWCVLTAVVHFAGGRIVAVASPLIEYGVECLLGDVVARVAAGDASGAGEVTMTIHAVRPMPISGDHVMAPWVEMQERIHAGHDLVPAVILLAIVIAWPYAGARERVRGALGGAAAATLLVVWMTSVHLAGLFEMRLQHVASYFHEPRGEPFHLTQMLFFESGGQWLFAVLAAAAVTAFVTRKSRSP